MKNSKGLNNYEKIYFYLKDHHLPRLKSVSFLFVLYNIFWYHSNFILQQKCPRNVTYRKIYDFLFEILKISCNAKKKMHL